jgi:hypothetical protein
VSELLDEHEKEKVAWIYGGKEIDPQAPEGVIRVSIYIHIYTHTHISSG